MSGRCPSPCPSTSTKPIDNEHYYDNYDYLDTPPEDAEYEFDSSLWDEEGVLLSADRYFGLWMKDMDEFIPDNGVRSESLEDLLHCHRFI